MAGKEDKSSCGPSQVYGPRKSFWRSASWSASRSASINQSDELKEYVDLDRNVENKNRQTQKFPIPLTPRSHHNSKARACLPPLQPLSIARRSLEEWPKAGSDDIGEWPQPPITPGVKRDMGNIVEGLKIDLSAIDPDKNHMRDDIICCDRECSKVAEHIYLGGDMVARDMNILKKNRITHILNCVGFLSPEYFKSDFAYKTLWLHDRPSEDITSILYDVFDYFECVREQGGRVFVHCFQGVSRSSSLVIAYLMWSDRKSFDDAFQYVKAARSIADPNVGFACQLLQCQKRVHASPLSPGSLLRMYRISPHSPYDPLHLVPKLLKDPSPSHLDSRGAFIIHVPSVIYIWVGKKCGTIMERDAREIVGQIVRYESVQGPITIVHEGDESECFWDTCFNIRDSSLVSCSGERELDIYNVDFEIFQNASMGGFVPPLASSNTKHETRLPVREDSWSVMRRKFASKFNSTPKLSLPRVYSDSILTLGMDRNFNDDPSLHSTNRPSLYHNHESVISNSELPSSTFPSFSNLSLLPPKSSHKSLPNTLAICDVNPTFNKVLPSLAERRGSLSKTLKLPTLVGNSKGITANDEDGMDKNFKLQVSYSSSSIQPLVWHWPSFERISTFDSGCLHTEAAYIFISPSIHSGKREDTIVYFWIGRSFSHDSGQNDLDSNKLLGLEKIDWKEIKSDIFTQIGFQDVTVMKIVKEGEEPPEFLWLLRSL